MKENKDCQIVQDLLPSYIEKLTTEETNQYIEEHLKNCDKCKKILENMQHDIQVNTSKIDQQEVNYFKKYNKKINILKIILLTILSIFIIVICRRMFILLTLSHKVDKIKELDNYYVKYMLHKGDKITIGELYKKGNKQKIQVNYSEKSNMYDSSKESKSKIIEFYDGNRWNYYTEKDNQKAALLNQSAPSAFPLIIEYEYSKAHIDSFWELLHNALLSSVSTATCNGQECYYFSNFKKTNADESDIGYRNIY